MKVALTPRDFERLPSETRVMLDMMLEGGWEPRVVGKREVRGDLQKAPLARYRIESVGTPCDNRTDRVRRSNDKPHFRRLDEWDLVQAFAPVHLPPVRYLDMASANGLLKEMYSPERIESLAMTGLDAWLPADPPLAAPFPFMPSLDRS